MPNTPVELEQNARRLRREVIIAELRDRIRPVCESIPEDLFLELIDRMAEIQLKYELLEQRARD
jgi:hypothetical protein